jgi:hypothetical protein
MAPPIFSQDVVQQQFTQYSVPGSSVNVNLNAANDIAIYPFHIPYLQQVSAIALRIWDADATHNSDIGIYDADGNLIANIGAQTIPTGSSLSFDIVQGTVVLGPGLYFLAFTSEATDLGLVVANNVGVDGTGEYVRILETNTTSSGGTLPSTITISQNINAGATLMHQGNPPLMILLP